MANIYKVTQAQYAALESGNSITLNGKTYEYEEDAIYIISDFSTPDYSLKYIKDSGELHLKENTETVSSVDLSRVHTSYYADKAGGAGALIADNNEHASLLLDTNGSVTTFKIRDLQNTDSNSEQYFRINIDQTDNSAHPTVYLGSSSFDEAVSYFNLMSGEMYFPTVKADNLQENGTSLSDKYAAKEYATTAEIEALFN